jgi:hypothetical protein
MIKPHNIMPPRCACGSRDVEHGYSYKRHGYLQLCEVCGLEMFWSSDLLGIKEVDAMHAAYRREHCGPQRKPKRQARKTALTAKTAHKGSLTTDEHGYTRMTG